MNSPWEKMDKKPPSFRGWEATNGDDIKDSPAYLLGLRFRPYPYEQAKGYTKYQYTNHSDAWDLDGYSCVIPD